MDKANILLVDDQPGKLLSYQALLENLGENLVLARSGREALQCLLRNEFALILLDVVMPDMDGFETATLIRQRPKLKHTPIIFLTSYSTSDLDRLKGYELGAVDYVFAPVIPEILRAKAAVFVELYRSRLDLARANDQLRGEIAERQRAQEQAQQAEAMLRSMNQTLETRVAERTETLERQTRELRDLNDALTRSNQELDDFAYVASHDLKEPLRGLYSYASFLKDDYAAKLDDAGRQKLTALQTLCLRMTNLIDGLLEYSRLGRVDLAVAETSLENVLRDVLELLRFAIEDSRVNVRMPRPLPTLRCDRARVGEVFRNLIANAIKYNERTEKLVEIGYLDAASPRGPIIFYVRDNGIGIREKHRDKVFGIFKRLHGRDAYGGGTGVGLTIVKKIVERHGGRVWIESTFGEGTTFFFTLQPDDPSESTRPC